MTGSRAGKECDVPCVRKEEETSLVQEYVRGAPIAPSDCVWGIVSRNSTPSLIMKNKDIFNVRKLHETLGHILPSKNNSHFVT